MSASGASGARGARARQPASEVFATRIDSPAWVNFAGPLLALAASWMAAGSAGLLGHALRHGLVLMLLGAAVLIGLSLPVRQRLPREWLLLLAVGVAALWLLSAALPAVNVLAVALVAAMLARDRPRNEQGRWLAAAAGVLALGIFKFASNAFPWFWLLSDWLSGVMTRFAGVILFRRLHGGLTYAGIDFLVTMGALLVCWTSATSATNATSAARRSSSATGPEAAAGAGASGRRWAKILRWIGLVGGAHLVYLAALAYAPLLLNALPAAKESTFGVTPRWDWAQGVRGFIPWNLPGLGGLLHLIVAWFLFRAWPAGHESAELLRSWRGFWPFGGRIVKFRFSAAIMLISVVVPLLATLNTQSLSLSGKKIVVYEKGFLNWLKPKHGEYGRLSVGMYGVLPEFLQSYGATCVVSPDLSDTDLAGASLLILIFPNKPWAPGQLDRIWNFTREGGSLLVLGEHTVEEKEGGNRFNDVLQPTALRVAFDSALFAIGGWLESYDALSHPATAGLEDHRNEFGVVVGASVLARWPAQPLLVGRFGWADQGDVTNDEKKGGSMMGNHRYDNGEKLGDVLLAAEQRFGRGRVMVFGDTSGFTNTILLGAHEFVTRLFGYLCNDAGISWWRRGLAAGGLLLLLAGLWSRLRAETLGLAAFVVGASLMGATAWSHHMGEMLPDGRSTTPNRLAYLDASHLERSSAESWRESGLGGLHLTLMRNGYLVLALEKFDRERLQRAGLFVSAAPSKPFAPHEIQAVREFIASGGTFICTVGWPESGPSRALLADLGFYVGGIGAATSGSPEPKPFGHFKAPYFNGGDYMAYVRFHAAWHVESSDPQAQPLAYGPRDPKGPPDAPDPAVILMRRIGRGKAIVIADTHFASNQNLEREGGQPFEGMRENSDFWRWFIAFLNDQPGWTPPKPAPVPTAGVPGTRATNPTNPPPGGASAPAVAPDQPQPPKP